MLIRLKIETKRQQILSHGMTMTTTSETKVVLDSTEFQVNLIADLLIKQIRGRYAEPPEQKSRSRYVHEYGHQRDKTRISYDVWVTSNKLRHEVLAAVEIRYLQWRQEHRNYQASPPA